MPFKANLWLIQDFIVNFDGIRYELKLEKDPKSKTAIWFIREAPILVDLDNEEVVKNIKKSKGKAVRSAKRSKKSP